MGIVFVAPLWKCLVLATLHHLLRPILQTWVASTAPCPGLHVHFPLRYRFSFTCPSHMEHYPNFFSSFCLLDFNFTSNSTWIQPWQTNLNTLQIKDIVFSNSRPCPQYLKIRSHSLTADNPSHTLRIIPHIPVCVLSFPNPVMGAVLYPRDTVPPLTEHATHWQARQSKEELHRALLRVLKGEDQCAVSVSTSSLPRFHDQ